MAELIMCAYCGMRTVVMTGSIQDCHARAKRMRDRHEKQGGTVSELSPSEWELETPEDAVMVSDEDGILRILEEDKDAISSDD